MDRLRHNFTGGIVENDPLTISGTTLTSQGLAALPIITSGANYLALVLDPDGVNGAPEIVWVTVHASLSTSATITRAKEGSTAREHNADTYWVHAATAYDWDTLVINTDDDSVGGRIFVGSVDPDTNYTLQTGDVWIAIP